MSKVLVSLSGGMDSVTLLGYMLDVGNDVKAVSFLYGSKHNKYELQAAKDLCNFYKVEHVVFDLRSIFENISSNLLLSGGQIPEGHYEDSTMKQTVVPGRNHIFAAILAGIAESEGYDYIALAVHAGDHHIYPDCRPKFIIPLSQSILAQTENKVEVKTPFLYFDKQMILEVGFNCKKPVPYELTRTCYKDQQLACGKCGACQERLESWERIGKKDPVQYE